MSAVADDGPFCPECGAKVAAHWKFCWLCGAPQPARTADQAPAAAATRGAGSAGSVTSTLAKVAGAGLALGAMLILIGLVADQQYGAAICVVLLLLPAAAWTIARSASRKAKGTPATAAQQLGTFLMSLAVTLGTIVALGIAAIVAFCVICFGMLATGNLNMH